MKRTASDEKKLTVTLLAINAKYVHSSLAVWYLAGAVLSCSHCEPEISVVEATINQPDSEIMARVEATAPQILGISVYIWNARKVEALIRDIKIRLPGTRIILGGPEASNNAEHWLAIGADFVIRGEGERSFPQVLDALASGAADTLVRVITAEPCDTVIDPYSDTYFSALGGRIAYLETSRGCPFKCAFCLSGGSRLRFFPLDMAKEQLRRLSQSGARTVKLVDRTFNCNADRSYELFEYVISLDTPCRFHFEVAADLFDERTLSLLRTAPPGRIQLEAGLQSFNQPTLDAVSRQTSPDKTEQNLRALLDGQNIHIHIDLIAGLPLEGLQDFARGFDRAYTIGAHTLQLGFLKLLHGSALREQAERWGIRYSAAPPYEITGSPWLSAADLDIIKSVEHALERIYNCGRFVETARYALSATGMPPFELYLKLGAAASGYRIPLGSYAEQIYMCISGLPGVDIDVLRNHMIRDWLCAMRGKNLPEFLRVPGGGTRQVAAYARSLLGRKIERSEAFVLWNGVGVFVDSRTADPVTGRYKLYEYDG